MGYKVEITVPTLELAQHWSKLAGFHNVEVNKWKIQLQAIEIEGNRSNRRHFRLQGSSIGRG